MCLTRIRLTNNFQTHITQIPHIGHIRSKTQYNISFKMYYKMLKPSTQILFAPNN